MMDLTLNRAISENWPLTFDARSKHRNFLFKETLKGMVSAEAILIPNFFYLIELLDLQQSTRLELKIDKSKACYGRILLKKCPIRAEDILQIPIFFI